ncbi:hypothetical protein GP486_004107 [Trichoglossum hirsutum]|uniref:Uncharacterized protein n=1 Tax=Trichoglossum hirsutum TaxID=265104 RepID=A0A9P8LBT6_9PEZI|nr:hypothetical protein GP486_004107 [Trichoglossum hirsutum]
MWPFKVNYTSLREKDEMDDESNTGLISQTSNVEREASTFRIHTGFALVHTIIAMLWLSVFWTYTPLCRQSPEALRPLELVAAAEAISYETVIFDISGGGTRENPITPYEGPPTPEKDMRWWELINGQPQPVEATPLDF